MSFLSLQDVRKHYGPVAAVDGVTLDLPAGGRTAIVGPSGSGKTTLLRIIAGFEAPDQGRVTLDGVRLADGAEGIPAHRRSIGVVAQDGALFPHLTVADNIGFGLDRRALGRDAAIVALIELVGLDKAMLRRKPDELSGGQQQRVALARALARKPRLMLLDEPFSALDTALRASTRKAVSDLLAAADITTLLVTHDQEEALSFADQVAVMREGRLLQVGAPRELYLRPKDPMIARFIGEAIILPALAADGFADCALGRVIINSEGKGAVRIMLRPEQISLTEIQAGIVDPDPGTVLGAVTEINANGSACSITVRILNGAVLADAASAHVQLPLPLRRIFMDVPAVGAVVRIAVSGPAHIFESE
jgi:iron(III) transport system ATP-binding protein